MNRLLITGTNSGGGKTTVTCAVLSAFKARGIVPMTFKCGPDYIDTMFHRAVSGVKSYNLDPFFLDGKGLRSHLAAHAGELSVIEGAMGYYDGIAATEEASAYTVARETKTPAVLVVSAQGVGATLAAIIEGLTRHRQDSCMMGVVFNDAKISRYPDLEKIAARAGIKFYGTMPRNEEWTFPSRHLGLLAAAEIADLQDKLRSLGRQAEQTIDIDGLLALAKTAVPLKGEQQTQCAACARLAVARDEAFCFLYEENLELLQALGCELVFFSPLKDSELPANINGLYLCGGYPELHAKMLSNNKTMLQSIQQAVESNLPTVAESGGFLYLHETLDGLPMCGVIPGRAYKTDQLRRFGYIELTAVRDNLLCQAGASIRSHEFHYWDSSCPGDGFTAKKAGRSESYLCIHATDTLFAGFPQLYFPANLEFAKQFVRRMKEYSS